MAIASAIGVGHGSSQAAAAATSGIAITGDGRHPRVASAQRRAPPAAAPLIHVAPA